MDQFALFSFSNFYCYQNQLYDMWRFRNPPPFVQIPFNFGQNLEQYYNSNSLPGVKESNCDGHHSSKTDQKSQNFEAKQKNKVQMSDHIKAQEQVQQVKRGKKQKNNDFLYYDPGEAPYLTFGIGDIQLKQTKSLKQIKTENVQKIDIEFRPNKQNEILSELNAQKSWQFHVTEPNPYFSPFLIIKSKPSKRRLLSLQVYEKRAEQIQKRRIKNLQRLEIEQRIGKKLPTKNKKWQRKKQSLVFNANEYKKKLMNSKKFKSSEEKYKELFTVPK